MFSISPGEFWFTINISLRHNACLQAKGKHFQQLLQICWEKNLITVIHKLRHMEPGSWQIQRAMSAALNAIMQTIWQKKWRKLADKMLLYYLLFNYFWSGWIWITANIKTCEHHTSKNMTKAAIKTPKLWMKSPKTWMKAALTLIFCRVLWLSIWPSTWVWEVLWEWPCWWRVRPIL